MDLRACLSQRAVASRAVQVRRALQIPHPIAIRHCILGYEAAEHGKALSKLHNFTFAVCENPSGSIHLSQPRVKASRFPSTICHVYHAVQVP